MKKYSILIQANINSYVPVIGFVDETKTALISDVKELMDYTTVDHVIAYIKKLVNTDCQHCFVNVTLTSRDEDGLFQECDKIEFIRNEKNIAKKYKNWLQKMKIDYIGNPLFNARPFQHSA